MTETAVSDEPVPLVLEPDGTIRVRGTRVTLESIFIAFDAGASPEEITQSFSTLQLADVYATMTYCLRHRGDVDAYLAQRQKVADEIRDGLRARFDQTGLRERLLARLGS